MSVNHSLLWKEVQQKLKGELPKSTFETWFGELRPQPSSNGDFRLAAPNGFIKRGLERNYLDLIEECLVESSEDVKEVSIEVREMKSSTESGSQTTPVEPSTKEQTTSSSPTQKNQSSDQSKIPLNKEYTFDNFVQGKGNQLAFAASQAAAESPAQAYNPLFIYANVGLGKTHLLHAVGNYLKHHLDTVGEAQVTYTTSERFAIEMIQAIRKNKTEEFRKQYRSVDGFLLDDVQFLQNKEGTQEELFHTFNELYGNGKQIVLTSDRPPDELSDLQNRLVSRFRWGLVADIQPPNFETRMAILRKKANQKGIQVSDSVLELIAKRITSNVRALEGALIKAVARADLANTELGQEDLEPFLPDKDADHNKQLTVDVIKKEVANNYDLTCEDLEGSSRKQEVAQARHIAIYLAREMTDSSFPALGEKFGGRDHSTVMHSHRKINEMIDETPLFYEEIKEIEQHLRSTYE